MATFRPSEFINPHITLISANIEAELLFWRSCKEKVKRRITIPTSFQPVFSSLVSYFYKYQSSQFQNCVLKFVFCSREVGTYKHISFKHAYLSALFNFTRLLRLVYWNKHHTDWQSYKHALFHISPVPTSLTKL